MRSSYKFTPEDLSQNGQKVFQDRLIRKTFSSDQIILERGDRVSGAYFVLKGALRVYAITENGRELNLYRILPGETCILALNALFNDFLYPAWVEAEGDSQVGVLHGSVYRSLFAEEPSVQDMTIQALSSAIFGLMSKLEHQVSHTVEHRLAEYLVLQAGSDGVVRNTQQEIADRIDTTREVVGRHIVQFVNQGLIKSGRGKITILNSNDLSSLTVSNQ